MKIPFDIKYRPQVESGEYKVETRSGREVKKISFSGFDSDVCPVVAAVVTYPNPSRDIIFLYNKKGECFPGEKHDNDLFLIIPDEEIRRELVNFILYKAGHLIDEETEHKFIAYLEKQKARKED